MRGADFRSRALVIVGSAAMVIGALDPLEGSVVILLGTALAALGAVLAHSRHRRRLFLSLTLVAIGVAILFGLSAVGGFGGDTGRSMWWALLLLPYPVGWIVGVVAAFRTWSELRHRTASV